MRKEKVKENYKIEGSIKKAKLDILNQLKLENLNFNFNINKNNYSLKKINAKFNNIDVIFSQLKLKSNIRKIHFLLMDKFLNDNKNFDIKEIKPILPNLFSNIDVKEIEFSSKNSFSFNINKKFKDRKL